MLAALVLQDVLLLLWSILDVKFIFTVYIFFTDLADSLFMVQLPPPPSLPPSSRHSTLCRFAACTAASRTGNLKHMTHHVVTGSPPHRNIRLIANASCSAC